MEQQLEPPAASGPFPFSLPSHHMRPFPPPKHRRELWQHDQAAPHHQLAAALFCQPPPQPPPAQPAAPAQQAPQELPLPLPRQAPRGVQQAEVPEAAPAQPGPLHHQQAAPQAAPALPAPLPPQQHQSAAQAALALPAPLPPQQQQAAPQAALELPAPAGEPGGAAAEPAREYPKAVWATAAVACQGITEAGLRSSFAGAIEGLDPRVVKNIALALPVALQHQGARWP